MGRRGCTLLAAAAALLAGCGSSHHQAAPADAPAPALAGEGTAVGATSSTSAAPATTLPPAATTTTAGAASTSPTWVLGARPLRKLADGTYENLPTPPALRDRRLQAADRLAPPADGGWHGTVSAIDDATAARMGTTWQPGCPVPLADLRLLTVSFWGFDARAHTGELVVAATEAQGVVRVFQQLFQARFPIEDLHLPGTADVEAPPTGDGNESAGMVCRPKRGGTSWSEHALGTAIDLDPFQNPYEKDGRFLPELAGAYADRGWARPGMITPNGVVVKAFASIGWRWGGSWTSPKDLMHFSKGGR